MTTAAAREKRYALLSAGGWRDVAIDGLEIAPDGTLQLLRVPALDKRVDLAPGLVPPSGLALDCGCGLFVADASRRRVVRVALDCGERLAVAVDGPPAGLDAGPYGWLFVADPSHGRVLALSTPTLTARDEWVGLAAPEAVACDGSHAVYVLEAGPPPRVRRFDLSGRGGTDVDCGAPRAIAVADDGTLYVADAAARCVRRFERDGGTAGAPLAAGTDAQALAVSGDRLFAADIATGRVLILDRRDGRDLGAVAGFRGPVSALAADARGSVYLKTAGDATYLVARAGAARVARGSATGGAWLDAGSEGAWFRAVADAAAPPGTTVQLEVEEDAAGWRQTPAADAYLSGGPRRVRLRVILERDEQEAPATATPTVSELRAVTEGESYLDHLPNVYARDAEPGALLLRLLALLHAAVGDREDAIDGTPRSLDPASAPAASLPWLASWQAFELPEAADEERRALLAELPRLFARAGTPAGVARAAEIHTGLRPVLIEHFRSRGIWALDGVAELGVDTVLHAAAPGGLTVGSDTVGAAAPEQAAEWGAILFDATAHRFTAVVPAAALGDDGRRVLERVLDEEKPAHTAYHLCAAGPRMRVGVQALLGLDSIVGGDREALTLGERGQLALDARTAAEIQGAPGTVGRRGILGADTLLA